MSATSAAITDGLARLWVKFLPDIEKRLAVLESFAALMDGRGCSLPLEDEVDVTAEAQSAAHKLGGILGTFGLVRGTELARKVEQRIEAKARSSVAGREIGLDTGLETERKTVFETGLGAGELTGWVSELRLMIEERKR